MKPHLNKNVFLIGFMGAGKTTVSRRLAKKCSAASVDVDYFIERNTGISIPEIFEKLGESGFRDIETDSLIQICNFKTPSIVSCGGGIIVRQKNIDIMKENGVILHLLTDVDNSFSRIKDSSTRPLFNDRASVEAKYNDRINIYRDIADIEIDTRGHHTGNVVYLCIRELSRRNIVTYK